MATAKKGVRKGFFEVSAPITSAKLHVYGTDLDEFDGKTIKLDMTRSLRGKSFEVTLNLKKEGDKLIGSPTKMALAGSFIRRSMRKGTDYVEDSFSTDSKDGTVIVKPFMITRNRVSRTVRASLRDTAREFLQGYVRIRNLQEIFSDMMTNKLQKELSFKLKKIYPLAFCEIRVLESVKEPAQLLK
jgi:ribosomal protein S3AE